MNNSTDPFLNQHKDMIEKMMLDTLGEVICKSTGIDRNEHRKATNNQVDKIKELECDVFHFGFFSDLIEGDTKAEAKALMNNIMPDFYKMPNQVSNTQLRMTSYVYYRAMYNLTLTRIKHYLESTGNAPSVTPEHIEQANKLGDMIANLLFNRVEALGKEVEKRQGEEITEADKKAN